MPSRGFPAPPDLAELLKFFESSEGKARVSRQQVAPTTKRQSRPHRSALSKGLSSDSHVVAKNARKTPPATKSTTIAGRLSNTNSSRKTETTSSTQGWNASTLLPPAPTKPLRHQILSRSYQPPAPSMVVVPAEESQLLDRLSKGTISSRSKLHRQTEHADKAVRSDKASNLADTRGRDAIQTLLFYRKEVERRRRLDPNDSRTGEQV